MLLARFLHCPHPGTSGGKAHHMCVQPTRISECPLPDTSLNSEHTFHSSLCALALPADQGAMELAALLARLLVSLTSRHISRLSTSTLTNTPALGSCLEATPGSRMSSLLKPSSLPGPTVSARVFCTLKGAFPHRGLTLRQPSASQALPSSSSQRRRNPVWTVASRHPHAAQAATGSSLLLPTSG